jgi:cyanophycin synthetase
MLDMASIPVASGSICKRRRFGRDHKKITPIVLKPLDGNHGKGASINVEIGKMWCLAFTKNTANASL